MAYNFRKEQKELYVPGKNPSLINVPMMKYLAVRGHGDPNQENSEDKKAIEKLYAVAYTIKMSKKGTYQIPDYFDFVVPPLEGLWWQDGITGIDYAHKEMFSFIAMIRLPNFVTQDVFDWTIQEAGEKKQLDLHNVEFLSMQEGLCVQALHIGSYDNEPATIDKIHKFIEKQGLQVDINDDRHHHEIYLSDPRRTKIENLKTVLRNSGKKQLKTLLIGEQKKHQKL